MVRNITTDSPRHPTPYTTHSARAKLQHTSRAVRFKLVAVKRVIGVSIGVSMSVRAHAHHKFEHGRSIVGHRRVAQPPRRQTAKPIEASARAPNSNRRQVAFDPVARVRSVSSPYILARRLPTRLDDDDPCSASCLRFDASLSFASFSLCFASRSASNAAARAFLIDSISVLSAA